MKKTSLNGNWRISGKDMNGNDLSFYGLVPGTVHTDLKRLGIIKNPLVSDNNKDCLWIEKVSWEYEKNFSVDFTGKKVSLVFSMLDVYCDVYLNGVKLGYCDNMFIPHSFDVTDVLKSGENTIRVRFYPPDDVVADKPKREAAFTWHRVYTRRVQCSYSWDWLDRFVTMGICGDVTLCTESATEIDNVHIRTLSIDKFSAQLSVNTEFSSVSSGTWLFTEIVSPCGELVYTGRKLVAENSLYQIVDISNPSLWYPSGYGEQPLYTIKVSVEDNDGNVLSQKTVVYGIRKVKILQLEDEPGSKYYQKCVEISRTPHIADYDYSKDNNKSFSGFVVIVNDIPIMCKGANWVPSEPVVSEETPEKITAILELAKEAGMNLIRVWGGGIFETEHFYAECDRLGLMVCQDFLMACGDYPQQEEDFCIQLKKEAEYISKRLRNNCCLIWWSGDNENAMWANDDMEMYNGRIVCRNYIEPVVRKNDPDTYFFPSSPYGGYPYGCATCGTTHNTGYLGITFEKYALGDMKNYREEIKDYISRFSVEEPIMGATSEQTALKFMTMEEFLDPEEKMWRFHTKNTPSLTEYEIYDVIKRAPEKTYGEYTDVYDKLYKMQYFQYEQIVLTMELYRRNKGFSNGILYWMLNDCWPAFGWAIIDYYVKPKAAWYGFKRTAKGVIASVDNVADKLLVYICNDTLDDVSGDITVYRLEGENCDVVYSGNFSCGANVSDMVCEFKADTASSECIYICDMSAGDHTDRALWYRNRLKDTKVKRGKTEIVSQGDGCVTLRADGYVHAVMLEGDDIVFENNCFPMLSGETVTINFRTENSDAKIKVLSI